MIYINSSNYSKAYKRFPNWWRENSNSFEIHGYGTSTAVDYTVIRFIEFSPKTNCVCSILPCLVSRHLSSTTCTKSNEASDIFNQPLLPSSVSLSFVNNENQLKRYNWFDRQMDVTRIVVRGKQTYLHICCQVIQSVLPHY